MVERERQWRVESGEWRVESGGTRPAPAVLPLRPPPTLALARARRSAVTPHTPHPTAVSYGIGIVGKGGAEDAVADGPEHVLIDPTALLRRCRRRFSHYAGATRRGCWQPAVEVPLELAGGQIEVTRAVHAHTIGEEVEEQGCLGLAGM